MSKSFRSVLRGMVGSAATIAALTLLPAGMAGASVVTVGSPLTGTSFPVVAGGLYTSINPGTLSPVSGTVISWQVIGTGGPFRFRVMQPGPESVYTGTATSAPVFSTSPGVQTFPTNLPIKAGQTISFDNGSAQDHVGVYPTPGRFLLGSLQQPDGIPTELEPGGEFELAFNAQVLPPPTIASLSAKSGSIKGGEAVTISGTDLSRASAVSFGGAPAASFTAASDSQVMAVAPAAKTIAPVGVTVTTPAGAATAPEQFAYEACQVPKLKGKSLKQAKKLLRKRHCKVGKVRKRGDVTAKDGEVVKQGGKPAKLLAPGTRVNVTLG